MPPPNIILIIPYFAAKPIATTCDTSPHSEHINTNMKSEYSDLSQIFHPFDFGLLDLAGVLPGSNGSFKAPILSAYSFASSYSLSLLESLVESSLSPFLLHDLNSTDDFSNEKEKYAKRAMTRIDTTTLGRIMGRTAPKSVDSTCMKTIAREDSMNRTSLLNLFVRSISKMKVLYLFVKGL